MTFFTMIGNFLLGLATLTCAAVIVVSLSVVVTLVANSLGWAQDVNGESILLCGTVTVGAICTAVLIYCIGLLTSSWLIGE